MPTDKYKEAEEKWLNAKNKYIENIALYEAICKLLEINQIELDTAFNAFSVQQAIRVQGLKQASVKEVK
jgi:hypothetical protein